MVEFVSECRVKLVGHLASDNDVAMAAWVSHDADSEDRLEDQKKVKGLINFLYRNKHMSPFEHGIFKFRVDVPLFVAREFQRHRTFSYNEVSGRYTQMKPRFWRGNQARVQKGTPGDYYFEPASDEQTAIYLREKELAVTEDWARYQRLLEAGIAKEQAREDLPLSLMTQFYATCNPRNLMQFLTLRNEKHALQEIQDVARKMESYLEKIMPYTYEAFRGADFATGGLVTPMSEDKIKQVINNDYIVNVHAPADLEGQKAALAAIQRSFAREDRRRA